MLAKRGTGLPATLAASIQEALAMPADPNLADRIAILEKL
jgi:hypothetical protein